MNRINYILKLFKGQPSVKSEKENNKKLHMTKSQKIQISEFNRAVVFLKSNQTILQFK